MCVPYRKSYSHSFAGPQVTHSLAGWLAGWLVSLVCVHCCCPILSTSNFSGSERVRERESQLEGRTTLFVVHILNVRASVCALNYRSPSDQFAIGQRSTPNTSLKICFWGDENNKISADKCKLWFVTSIVGHPLPLSLFPLTSAPTQAQALLTYKWLQATAITNDGYSSRSQIVNVVYFVLTWTTNCVTILRAAHSNYAKRALVPSSKLSAPPIAHFIQT